MHRRQFLKDTSIVVASSLVADQDHETPAKIEFGKSTFKTKFSDAQKTSIPDQLKSDEVISGIFRWES